MLQNTNEFDNGDYSDESLLLKWKEHNKYVDHEFELSFSDYCEQVWNEDKFTPNLT